MILQVKDDVVQYITIGSEKPKWYSTKEAVEWDCNLSDYASTNINDLETYAVEEEKAQTSETTKEYAGDPIVNRFINEYNALYPDDQITDAERGNIRTKYFVTIGGLYTELLNANDNAAECFVVKINGGNTDADLDPLLKAFSKVVKVLEPDIDDVTLQAGMKELTDKNGINTTTIGKTLEVTYVRSVELSWGRNNFRIDIDAKNYK